MNIDDDKHVIQKESTDNRLQPLKLIIWFCQKYKQFDNSSDADWRWYFILFSMLADAYNTDHET